MSKNIKMDFIGPENVREKCARCKVGHMFFEKQCFIFQFHRVWFNGWLLKVRKKEEMAEDTRAE